MEIHILSNTTVFLTFSTGSIIVNPIDTKEKKLATASTIVNTYPIAVPGWSTIFTPKDGQHVFVGAGEYEKNDLYIQGFSSETVFAKKPLQTTTWLVDGDGIRILLLGDVLEKKDVQHAMAEVSSVDVLIPFFLTTKETRLDVSSIVGIASNLQAQRIVPMGDDGVSKTKLAKEIGSVDCIQGGKYVLKPKDLSEGQTKVVVFE